MALDFEDPDDFFDDNEFNDPISYTPKGGSATTVDAIIDRADEFQEPYDGVGMRWAYAEITVKRSEVATPQWGDLFTGGDLGSSDWELDPARGVTGRDANFFTIAVRRREE